MIKYLDTEVKIHSVIENLDEYGSPEGEPEINIMTLDGIMGVGDGVITLGYTETHEGGSVRCTVNAYYDGRVSISRRESVVCDLLFKEGEECVTVYSVPPYKFDMTVKTRRVRNTLSERGGRLQLIYGMTVGGQGKNCNMKIDVRVK